jgi:hypothetical protein
MITLSELKIKLPAFSNEAKLFFHAYGLGELVLDKPIDHVALKALDNSEYGLYLEHIKPFCSRLSYEPVGTRQIATAELYDRLDSGTFGPVGKIEIMEPKPDAAVTTHDMIDHIELVAADLDSIYAALSDKGANCKMQITGNRRAVVTEINEWGQEVKFRDRAQLDIIESELLS